MVKSKLPNSVLRRVWALSDIDGDGMLDRDEFAVAMFLIDHKISGNDIPEYLPSRVIPPSKRAFLRSQQNAANYSSGGRERRRDREIDDPMYHSHSMSSYSSGSYSVRAMRDYNDDEEDRGNGLAGYVEQ